MNVQSREQWIALLDAATRSTENLNEEDWKWLMKELGLPANYFLAVRVALAQGRWREARNPRAYLKTVVSREAKKMGLDKDMVGDQITVPMMEDGKEMGYEEALEQAIYTRSSGEAVKGSDGVWRKGGGWDEDDPDYDDSRFEFDSVHDFLMSKLSDNLKIVEQPSDELKATVESINSQLPDFHLHLRDIVQPDWERWADIAGFDRWEKLVLASRCSGKSRDKALAEQPDEQSRKALQAAWRRFDRTGIARLKEGCKKIL